jgi:Restriction endonuclease BglII
MRFITHSYRHGEAILRESQFLSIYNEVVAVISNVTDEDLKSKHLSFNGKQMSLSRAINDVLKERFMALGWREESPIFQDTEYEGERWRLDFAKNPISIEVAFNHGEAIAWNLLKPVLASELNHVQKAIQTEVGIVITATENLKRAGAFDSAVGEYEKFLRYLPPLSSVLTVPMLIIGLEAPETFRLEKTREGEGRSAIIEI